MAEETLERGCDNKAFEDDGPSRPEAEEKEKTAAEPRQQWSSNMDFLMSCIAMSVGLGNIWRFPFTAYENGGGAFLVPYLIVMITVGKPLYYLEMGLGQFSACACVRLWNVVPALAGVGYGQIFATTMVLTYYCSLMALTIFYLFASFAAELPWGHCDKAWGDECFDSSAVNSSMNITGKRSSSELYLMKTVLHEPAHIGDGLGVPGWELTLCLLMAWAIISLVVVRGVKSSGKAAYFLALFPYVVLTTLLIRGLTLPGAVDGISYFIIPKWEELLKPSVWYAAVSQAFFSLNICFGSLIVYSSYNDFSHNIYRDVMIVTSLDTLTSLLAGCTTFSILGNLAYELKADSIEDVVQGGVGLAFISYPDAIAKFGFVPQLFSALFFTMLLTLGVGSAVSLIGAIAAIILDRFPSFKYWVVVVVTSVLGFLVGLVYITPGGQFIVNLVDFYAVTFVVFPLACTEVIAIAWLYGVDNVCQDFEFMIGSKVGLYWRLCWGLLTPLLLLVVLVYSAVTTEPLTYSKIPYPDSSYVAGYVLLAFGVLQLPIWAAYQLLRNRDLPFQEMIKVSLSPNKLWGPQNHTKYREWCKFKADHKQAEKKASNNLCRKVLRRMCNCATLDVTT